MKYMDYFAQSLAPEFKACYNESMKSAVEKKEFYDVHLYILPDSFLTEMRGAGVFHSLLVTDIGCFPRAHGHYRERPEGCDSCVLIVCTDGEGTCAMDGAPPFTLTRGQAVVLPPGIHHRYGASRENPWTIYWMHFEGAVAGVFADWAGIRPALSPSARSRLEELFHECFHIAKGAQRRSEYFYLCQLAGHILALVQYAPVAASSGRGEAAVEKAVGIMKQRLQGSLTLEELSVGTGYSVSYLTQLFRRTQQCPPIEYYLRLKMQAAARDLYLTAAPVREVAADYGITDPFYFSRLFKRVMGVSPTEYRMQEKG